MLLDGAYELSWSINDIETGLDDPENFISFQISVVIGTATTGWVGIGFGKGQYMQGKDIIKCMFERNTNGSSGGIFWAMDSYSPVWFPDADTDWSTGEDNVYDVSGQFIDDLVIFEFKRPLIASDNWDYPIYKGTQDFIAAYQTGSLDAKHDTDHRTPGQVDWYTGAITVSSTNLDLVRLYHGLTMIGLFSFAYPTSAFVARFLRHKLWWKEFHKQLASLGLMTALTSAYFAVSTTKPRQYTTHGILGITCVVLLCCQVAGGYCVAYWLDNWKRGKWYQRIHYNHLFFAITLLTIAPVTLWYGWNELKPYDLPGLEYLPVWFIYSIILIIVGEVYRRYYPKYAANKEYSAFDSNYHVFTWDEIGEKVSAGACWIVIDKYVFDVTKWQFSHPGGRKILLDNVGTDCTKMFYGLKEVPGLNKYAHTEWAKKIMAGMIVGEVPPVTIVKAETTFQRNRQVSVQQSGNSDQKRKSGFANRNFNKYASVYPLDTANNIIDEDQEVDDVKSEEDNEASLDAFLEDSEINDLVGMIENGKFFDSDEDDKDGDDNEAYQPKVKRMQSKAALIRHKEYKPTAADLAKRTAKLSEAKRFRTVKLLNKTKMTAADCTRPIVLLEFDFKVTGLMSCGDYILLHNVDNETITRAYTPIIPEFILCDKGAATRKQRRDEKNVKKGIAKLLNAKPEPTQTADCPEKRLFLLVRLYNKGRMSGIIKKLGTNSTLRLTGPFERQQLLAPLDFGFGRKCWRRLILLAGGTGITPMFNLLYHHLKHGTKRCKVLLIWYNKTTSDIACADHLKFVRNQYVNRFWVDLIFSDYANNTDKTIERELFQFARIHEYKWKQEETLAMIRSFLNDGEPIDLKAKFSQDGRALSVSSALRDDIESDSDNGVEMIDVKTENGGIGKNKYSGIRVKQLNPFDRIVLSGPKPFVEKYLEWLNNAEDLSTQNIGRQIISLD